MSITPIDLRSDTMSLPSADMLEALTNARIGDDVYGEDEETSKFERYAADTFGYEESLYTLTGTMANLLALLAQVPRGGEIVVGKNSHIFLYEVAGASALGGIAFHTVDDSKGIPSVGDVEAAIRHPGIYYPDTGLICLENTHNLAGGLAFRPEDYSEIVALARRHELPLHLDGARLLHAFDRWNLPLDAFSGQFDTISITLSKGLGAPAGGLLLGSKTTIDKARRYRKMIGGGLHQSGYLAAMGRHALQFEKDKITESNRLALALARKLDALGPFSVRCDERVTNILYVWLKDETVDAQRFVSRLEESGIKVIATNRGYRLIVYPPLNEEDVERVYDVFAEIFARDVLIGS